jgi:predicted dehydrogenase
VPVISLRLRPGEGSGPDACLARQPYFQQMERFLIHKTAIHLIDTFRFLVGEIVAVAASLRRLNPAIKGEDAGLVLFSFEQGATGLFDGNRLAEHVSDRPRRTMGELWLDAEAASLRLDGLGRLLVKPFGEPEVEHAYDWRDVDPSGHSVLATQAHITSHRLHGGPLETGGRIDLRNIQIEEAICRSAREARWITV